MAQQPFTPTVSQLFKNPSEDLDEDLMNRRKILAAGRVGSPGKISTLLGYSGLPSRPQD